MRYCFMCTFHSSDVYVPHKMAEFLTLYGSMQFSVSVFGLYEIQKLLFHLFFYVISKWHTVERSVGNLRGNKGYRNLKRQKICFKMNLEMGWKVMN